MAHVNPMFNLPVSELESLLRNGIAAYRLTGGNKTSAMAYDALMKRGHKDRADAILEAEGVEV